MHGKYHDLTNLHLSPSPFLGTWQKLYICKCRFRHSSKNRYRCLICSCFRALIGWCCCWHIFLIVGAFFFLLHNNYWTLCIYEPKSIFKWVLNVFAAWWTLETSAFIVLSHTLFFTNQNCFINTALLFLMHKISQSTHWPAENQHSGLQQY